MLKQICDDKRQWIAEKKRSVPENALLAKIAGVSSPRGFRAALEAKAAQQRVALIAEVKKASPSKGLIRADFDPVAIARSYERADAVCLSVLTDEKYFQGKDDYLVQVRAAVKLPVLRKDFMLDPYQIVEARSLGADCILLILAALSDAQAAELEAAAIEHGMDALVEVHDEAELERAFRLKSPMLGINNRNLKTMEVDIATTERLMRNIGGSPYLAVCESGIAAQADIRRMQAAGVHCFLVGESLMRQENVEAATRALLGE